MEQEPAQEKKLDIDLAIDAFASKVADILDSVSISEIERFSYILRHADPYSIDRKAYTEDRDEWVDHLMSKFDVDWIDNPNIRLTVFDDKYSRSKNGLKIKCIVDNGNAVDVGFVSKKMDLGFLESTTTPQFKKLHFLIMPEYSDYTFNDIENQPSNVVWDSSNSQWFVVSPGPYYVALFIKDDDTDLYVVRDTYGIHTLRS